MTSQLTRPIVNEGDPPSRRQVGRRVIGVESRKPFGPFAQYVAIVLDDRGSLFLAPASAGDDPGRTIGGRDQCRFRTRVALFNLFEMFRTLRLHLRAIHEAQRKVVALM
jgi:hypothetical protein